MVRLLERCGPQNEALIAKSARESTRSRYVPPAAAGRGSATQMTNPLWAAGARPAGERTPEGGGIRRLKTEAKKGGQPLEQRHVHSMSSGSNASKMTNPAYTGGGQGPGSSSAENGVASGERQPE